MTSRTEPAGHRPIACLRGDRSLTRAFQFLGKPWNALLLGSLTLGPTGFRELARSMPGISDSMLSDRLSMLAEVGLIERQVAEGPPVAVTYRLTEHGVAVIPALEQISEWAQ
jgi:DNA-binding HxlR family transcriptional regulator